MSSSLLTLHQAYLILQEKNVSKILKKSPSNKNKCPLLRCKGESNFLQADV
jgi:hypothetical protein